MAVDIKNIFVIDVSFVLAFLLDEGNIEVESIFEKQALGEIHFIAPSLLKYEVGNSLRTKLLRKKINKIKAEALYQAFLELEIAEEKVNYFKVFELALSKNLTFYDASYLYLSKNNKIGLLSLDHSLRARS
jgi:predicted nucleic acid-binding protein